MGNQRQHTRRYIKRLQHVVAHKIRQVADRLHRNSLVKQLQRLFTLNAKTAAEVRAVGWKTVKQLNFAFAQAFFQLGNIGSKT